MAFKTLGCKVNRVESEDIASDLLGRGCMLVPENEALVVIINSCTVTGEADRKARKAVRHALNGARAPIVVVTGCLATMDPQGLRDLSERVVVEADKERVADIVSSVLDLHATHHGHAVGMGEGFRTRTMLKIEDGCDNFCTYCIIPYARGVPRSVPLDQLIDRAKRLVEAGVAEIVLTGINIGRYRDGGHTLPDVVRRIAATGIRRLRLSSVEPPDVNGELLAALAETPCAVPHLHIPLQSGSDSVLAAMGRTYSAAEFEILVGRARKAVPGLVITTDVIAGFPGETWCDAVETIAMCERIGFSKMHVFRYSERPGTPAATMLRSVAPGERAVRAQALRMLGQSMRERFLRSLLGAERTVLVESVAGSTAIGTTGDYVRVEVEDVTNIAEGDLVVVRVTGREGEVAQGVFVGLA